MKEICINTIPLEIQPDKTFVEIPKDIIVCQRKFIEELNERVGLHLTLNTLVNDATYAEPTIDKQLMTNLIVKEMQPLKRTRLSDNITYSMNAYYSELDCILLRLIEFGEIVSRSTYHASIAPRNNVLTYLLLGNNKMLIHDTVHGISLGVLVLINLIKELDDLVSGKINMIIQCYTKEQSYIKEFIEYLLENASFLSNYKMYLKKLDFVLIDI